MTSTDLQTKFLSSSHFAVVGASKDESKIGSKLLKWYIAHDKNVVPLHLKEDEIGGIKTLKKLEELPEPALTSVSIVTPPKVTLSYLKDAIKLDIPYIWIQPGAEDSEVIAFIESNESLTSKVVYGGPCVLALGDQLLSKL